MAAARLSLSTENSHPCGSTTARADQLQLYREFRHKPFGGHLFRFKLTGNRRHIAVSDPRLNDLVADNLAPFDITESESLLIGRDFGVGTDIKTGPNGNLFVVSVTNGAIYEIFRR